MTLPFFDSTSAASAAQDGVFAILLLMTYEKWK